MPEQPIPNLAGAAFTMELVGTWHFDAGSASGFDVDPGLIRQPGGQQRNYPLRVVGPEWRVDENQIESRCCRAAKPGKTVAGFDPDSIGLQSGCRFA